MNVVASASPNQLRVTNTGSGANWDEFDLTASDLTAAIDTTFPVGDILVVNKRFGGSNLNLNLFIISLAIASTDNMDYLVAGAWQTEPDSGAADFGGFVDSIGVLSNVDSGSLNTYLSANSNTASYSGFSIRRSGFGSQRFDAHTRVNFDLSLGTGSNPIYEIAGSIEPGGTIPFLALEKTTIDATNWTFDGIATGVDYAGTYKGQLYGSEGNALGGTYTGAFHDGSQIFDGAFIADRD